MPRDLPPVHLIAYLVAVAALAIVAVLALADWLAIWGRRRRARDVAPDATVQPVADRVAAARHALAHPRPRGATPLDGTGA